jgi:hypothetical protein
MMQIIRVHQLMRGDRFEMDRTQYVVRSVGEEIRYSRIKYGWGRMDSKSYSFGVRSQKFVHLITKRDVRESLEQNQKDEGCR